MDEEYQGDHHYINQDNYQYPYQHDLLNESYQYDDNTSGDGIDTLHKDIMNVLSLLTEDSFVPEELSKGSKAALALLYVTVMLLALLGNILVILVISSTDTMQTVTNRFLLSLAGSDICMAMLNMPMTLLFYLKNEWILGEFPCKFSQYLQGVFVTVNILTLTAIAIDR